MVLKPVLLVALLLFIAVPMARAQESVTQTPVQTAAPVAPLPEKAKPAPAKPAVTGVTAYRNFIFGVSREDVRKYEKAVFYKEEGNSLYYLYQPDFFRRLIRYDFIDNKLVGVRHEIVELTLPNSLRIIQMAQDEQKTLTELYGEPTAQEFFWKDKRYEKYPEYWGRALYMKDLQIQITWMPPGARVVLQTYFDGNKYQIHYTIEKLGTALKDKNAIDLTMPPVDTPPATPQIQP